jgi:hypothetical protein
MGSQGVILISVPYNSSQGRSDLKSRSRVLFSCSWVVSSITCAVVFLVRSTEAAPVPLIADQVQVVVDRLRDELGISDSVNVSIQPQVVLVVSVEAPIVKGQPFRLAIEDGFLARLNSDELYAAIAHELGHVWLFTHHPYLQTERLANQIAMRVVTRDSLVSVYHKLWEHGGTRQDLNEFLGP